MGILRPEGTEPTPEADVGACKLLVKRVIADGVNEGNLAVLDEVLNSDFHGNLPGITSRAALKERLEVYREAVPDAHWTIEGQTAEGDMVVTNFVATGTQRGPLWGLPATGKRMAVTGTPFCRCREGRITEQRLQLDLLGLLQQLGVMPELRLEHEVLVARLLRDGRRASQVSE